MAAAASIASPAMADVTRRSAVQRSSRPEEMAAALAAIPLLPRAALVVRWVEIYGQPPPKGLSRRLLEYAVAYHVQAAAQGGLPPALRRKLDQVAITGAEPRSPATAQKTLPPGSRLVRQWRGRTYTVEVLPSGFSCEGRQYRSLSAVARAITGARWSGPRFFGS